MNIQTIPLSKLVASKDNVRKTGGSTVDDLAASIAEHGLLQNLCVLPADRAGNHQVVAGNRRLRAMQRLLEQGKLQDNAPVPCQIFDDKKAFEASLAENVVREAMHPADQFEAFNRIASTGASPAEIAARFGVSELVVQQRMKLARVSPKLLQVYRDGKMSLDQVTAYAAVDSIAEQEDDWRRHAKQEWEVRPDVIRQRLTKKEIDAMRDPRARFVGVAAYAAAGGAVRQDLFGGEGAGFLVDAKLLDRLTLQQLEETAKKLRDDKWKWVDCRVVYDSYRDGQKFKRVYESWNEPAKYSDEERAASGVIVTLGRDGKVELHRGLLKPGDKAPAKKGAKAGNGAKAKKTAAREDGALSSALVFRLTAHRTAAIAAELARDPKVAFIAATHALALSTLYRSGVGPVRVAATLNDGTLNEVKSSPATTQLRADVEAWRARLPSKDDDELDVVLWDAIAALPLPEVSQLLAVCVALSVSVVRHQDTLVDTDDPADTLARALNLDMTKYWQPTLVSYLGSVSKARILEALTEAGDDVSARRLANAKTGDAAREAERLLAGKNWLPRILRTNARLATPPKPAKKKRGAK